MNLPTIFKQCHTDIAVDIPPEIILCIFSNDKFIRLLDELNTKLQYHITKLHAGEYQTNIDLNANLISLDTGDIVGTFTITCISKPDRPNVIFTSLTIRIGDEDDENLQKYLKKGLSKLLVGINLQFFYNFFKDEDKNLIIDVDASSGFWGKMGLINVPEDIDADDDRTGYEKFILLKDAYKWALRKDCEINWCSPSFEKVFIKKQRRRTRANGKISKKRKRSNKKRKSIRK